MAEDRSGFLSRWARRKSDVRQGKPLEDPAVPAVPAMPASNKPVVASSVSAASTIANSKPEPEPEPGPALTPQTPGPEKLPSLDDVKLLTQESDFRPFMARNVASDVRNAAMKKLFTDPHYNVMDGLDIYISDYSIADPIPESMLRQMVGAKLLKIFDDEDDEKDENDGALEPHVSAVDQAASNVTSDEKPSVSDLIEQDGFHASVLPAPQESRQQDKCLPGTPDENLKGNPVLS